MPEAGHDERANMFRKIVTAIIVVPLAAVIVAFAIANRQAVTVSFDPFSATAPAYVATLPLFAVLFAVLILGVIAGGIAAWLRQAKWRRSARRLEAEVRSLQQEVDMINARQTYRSRPQASAESPLPPAIAPPLP